MDSETRHPILIVDDEPDVLFSLKSLLRHDFELHTAESGHEALQIMDEHEIHVLMTDQRMPGMTGVELVRRVRSEHPEAIRIVFTGYADIKAVVEAINSGGLYRYITKPWDPDDLIETLHAAAERYLADTARRSFSTDLKTLSRDAAQLAEELADSRIRKVADRCNSLSERATELF